MKFLNQIDGAKDLVQDSNNRLVTDAEKAAWNAKGTSNLTLGTTSSTAFRGDHGNTAYTHSQSAHAPSGAQINQTLTSGNGMAAWTATNGNLTIPLGTPSTLTTATTNAVTTTSHTHAIAFPVTSVAGKTGAVTLGPTDVGAAASTHSHGTYDRETAALTGANVFSDLVVVDGIVTGISTRALTLANLGYTGATNANYYTHPSGDGNLHVPATSTTNNGKVLKAGSTAGSLSWATDNDTITTINGKTGAIAKADITALGIPAQDTVYTHPANHPASIITQDASNRFVTDAEKTAWNAKGTSNLALGTTSSTAYRGDYGNTAYTHSQATHAPTNAVANQTLTSGSGMAAWTATSGNLTITLGTPSTLTTATTNAVTTTSHTHSVTFPVTSVAGKTGAITLGPTDVGAAASSHTHTKANITDLGTIGTVAALNTNASTSNYLRGDGTWVTPPNTVYTHPTTAGNKHIPSGGATGQFLKWSSNGTATWANDVADLAGAGRTTETVKGNADAIANRALTLNNGAEQTVTDKNKYYPLLSNVAGSLIGTHQTNVWSGSTWAAANNYGFGANALLNNTGQYSSGFGHYALSNNTGAQSNGFGSYALQNNEGAYSDGFGYQALQKNTGAYSNGFGYTALKNNTGAESNGFGASALAFNRGEGSNGFGTAALQNNTGENSNGFGSNALRDNTGTESNGFGFYAMTNNTGYNSNGFGNQALQYNTGQYSNGFGHFALHSNTGPASNGFGYYALTNNTGLYSNGFGYQALTNNTGIYSNGFGYNALQYNIGAFSSGFGYEALRYNTGERPNGFGYYALMYNQGSNNTAIGDSAWSTFLNNAAGAKTCAYTNINTTTSRATITAHGFGAANAIVNLLYSATTGTAIGGLGLYSIFQAKIIDANTIEFVNGPQQRFLWSAGTGTHTFTPQFAYENTTCLGADTVPNKSNQVVLGNGAVDTVKMGGTTRTPSSATATGVKGETCWDANYVYVCVATNTWKRSALTWSSGISGVLENYREKLVTLSGTSTTIDLSLGNVFTHSLTGNTTYTISNAVSGQAHSFTLIINQTATVRTITFPASVKWQGGEIPNMSTANKTYVLTFMTVDGGTNWLGMFGGDF